MQFSYEIFPTKTEQGTEKLSRHLELLKQHSVAFVSITCGAGGSTNKSNVDLCRMVTNTLNMRCLPHITGICSSLEDITNLIAQYDDLGISAYLILRGDPPTGQLPSNDFQYASDLCYTVHKMHPLNQLYVAGYPEGHQSGCDLLVDYQYQLEKATRFNANIITQLFFDNERFLHYLEWLDIHGFPHNVLAGIFPIINAKQIKRILQLSNANIPKQLATALEKYHDDDESMCAFGIEYASQQIANLHAQGHQHFHLYTMNQSDHINKIRANVATESTMTTVSDNKNTLQFNTCSI